MTDLPPIHSHETHILLACADARDLSQLHLDTITENIALYRQRGIAVDFHGIRTAGSFVTPDVVADFKRIFEMSQRDHAHAGAPMHFFIHLTTHGQLTPDSDPGYLGHVHRLHIVEGSKLNCGMLDATSVGIEIEQLLLEKQPIVRWDNGQALMNSEAAIRKMLLRVYAYDGYLAGDWIRSIDKLRTHPRAQRTELERAVGSDTELRTLDLKITAGIQDYSTHALVRVDGGDPPAPFWDDTQLMIRQKVAAHGDRREDILAQNDLQKPMAGLLCMTDPTRAYRPDAARFYQIRQGQVPDPTYKPNSIFKISGGNFDVPYSPFGPYVIAGFYYGVKHLGLFDQMVLGQDTAQTERIMTKIRRDPLMSLIVETFKVNLIPLDQQAIKRT